MNSTSKPAPVELDFDDAWKIIAKRSLCTLATASNNCPHVAAVLYVAVDETLYVNTLRTSSKARNIAANAAVSVCIPVRRVPVGPASSMQFHAHAELLDIDAPEIARLVEQNKLKAITSHGELLQPASCFVRIRPTGRINTYGLGMSLPKLARNPLHAAGFVRPLAA